MRRVRRRAWWPGRRFFLFYPVVLGIAIGYGVVLAVNHSLDMVLASAITGLPLVCVLSMVT